MSIALYIFWFLSAVLFYAEYCYFWQLKWYRIDRFRDYLGTKQGRQLLKNRYVLGRTVASILLFVWIPINHSFALYSIGAIFLSDILYIGWKKYTSTFRRPSFSIKAALIVVVALGVEVGVLVLTKDWVFVLFTSIFRLYVLSLIVIGINWTTNQIKRIYFRTAEKKLAKYPNLIKIGITGSYGKTSVKELLAQILSYKHTVAFTPKNINSDIGISKFILATDFSNIDICIVEMGAYNIGDIKLDCDIVHPSIGILTAINQQHLSLFGSVENIQQTKYELLQAIPKTGLAITNADNVLCMEYVGDLESRVETFGGEPENSPTCLVKSVRYLENKLSIEYTTKKGAIDERLMVTPSVIGEHQAYNIAPCILVAREVGMSNSEIVEAINRLSQPHNSIQIYQMGDAVVIDDSYNSNPAGFRAALDLLGTFPSDRRRIVITRGMHELGEESAELHEKIGNEISFFADELILTTPDFATSIRQGIIEKYHTDVREIFDTEALETYVKKLSEERVVILIENRVPDTIRHLYLHHK